jgi:uncharacterized repeat protein (TIGR03803 family)
VFAVNTDGTDFTGLHSFGTPESRTNSDGANPEAGLVLSGNTLYGTTVYGGSGANGSVFRVNTDGTSFTNLYSFTAITSTTNSDGANPYAGLVLAGNTLYGTTAYGGNAGDGTVFKVNTDGTGFTNLHNFTSRTNGYPIGTNSDGANPFGSLLLFGNLLYGTAIAGGTNGLGTVFTVNTDGTGFTNLYSFSAGDGGAPAAGLVLSGHTLYGTTKGIYINGTVFAVNTDGTGFTNLHVFLYYVLNDGSTPLAGLALSGSTLYGTTSEDGGNPITPAHGTVFAINTDGTGYTNLFRFTGADGDSYSPYAGLVLSGNTLYGTTRFAYHLNLGTVFALNLLDPIPLNVQLDGGTVILNWTNPAFFLQAAPMVNGVYTNRPGAVSPYTNTITDSQMFFRLQGN